MPRTKAIEQVLTFEDYCDFEEKSSFRHEFQNGKLVIMAGGTPNHAILISILSHYLWQAVLNQSEPISVFGSELKIFIEAINEGLYPDLVVVLGDKEYTSNGKAIQNPAIIIEVLSDSTGNYDRGDKFKKYKNIPSFQEYILVEQNQPVIDVLHKNQAGKWEIDSFIGLEDELQLNTIDIKIPLSKIYQHVDNLQTPQFKIDL